MIEQVRFRILGQQRFPPSPLKVLKWRLGQSKLENQDEERRRLQVAAAKDKSERQAAREQRESERRAVLQRVGMISTESTHDEG